LIDPGFPAGISRAAYYKWLNRTVSVRQEENEKLLIEEAKHITDFDIDFMLKALDHIVVFESGKLVVTFLEGTVIECNGE